MLYNSYIKEILEKNFYDIQKEVPIKSSKSFLFEYWNIFFYLYSKKYLEIFKQKYSKNYDKNTLDALNIDVLFKNNQSKEIDSSNISGNLFNSLSNNFAYGNPDYLNLNINNQNLIKNNLFQQQNNTTNTNFPYQNIMANIQKDLCVRNFPNLLNISNLNIGNNNINNNIKTQSQILQNINHQTQSQIPINNSIEAKINSNKNIENNNNKSLEKNKIKIKPKLKLTTLIKPKSGLKLFVTKNPKDELANQLINRKRKRFIKNKKLVFIPTDADNINQEDTNNNEQNDTKDNNIIQGAEKLKHNEEISENELGEILTKNLKPRGSKYRGVSRNGSQWQVLIMVEKKKRYVGSFSNEEEAARAYDKVALQHHGIKAKTNFDYSKEELENILNSPHLLKLD